MHTLLRQGDVLLQRTDTRPTSSTPVTDRGRVILAYGEVTGHCHQAIATVPVTDDPDPVAPCELFEEPDGTRLLVVRRPSSLVHDEHDPLALEIGTYQVIRQCEWTLDDVRQVAD